MSSALISTEQQRRELIGAWLASLRSANTRAAYARDMQTFLRFLDEHGLDLLHVRRSHIDLFARACEAEGSSEQTVARRLSSVSSFYRWATQEDMAETNPASNVRRPHIDPDTTTTAALTRREAEDLLEAARSHSARSLALVDLLLTTGVRISEGLGARVSDLSSDRIVIRRKGGTRAVIPLPEHTVAALREMTETTGTELARGDEQDPPLFTTRSGLPWDRHEAGRTLQRLARKAGIEKRLSPHVLRHTHATLALDLGVPLQHLQDSLGHRDPRTTRRYDHARLRLEQSSSRQVGALFD